LKMAWSWDRGYCMSIDPDFHATLQLRSPPVLSIEILGIRANRCPTEAQTSRADYESGEAQQVIEPQCMHVRAGRATRPQIFRC
jgi:hypothetical protein